MNNQTEINIILNKFLGLSASLNRRSSIRSLEKLIIFIKQNSIIENYIKGNKNYDYKNEIYSKIRNNCDLIEPFNNLNQEDQILLFLYQFIECGIDFFKNTNQYDKNSEDPSCYMKLAWKITRPYTRKKEATKELNEIINLHFIQVITLHLQSLMNNFKEPTQVNIIGNNNTYSTNSNIEYSFNKIEEKYDKETTETLNEIKEKIKESGNQKAAEIFELVSEELSKPHPKKSVLSILWEHLLKVLPSLAQVAGITNVVNNLLS